MQVYISGYTDDELLDMYISDMGLPSSKRDKSSCKGTLKKEFNTSRLTWRVFVKGLQYYQIKQFVVKIEILTVINRIYVAGIPVNLDHRE
jgi:hypothetical protein